MSGHNSTEYTSAFYTIPHRIMYLDGITIAYLRFYETIFQFWHRGKACYLSNNVIKERTGIIADSCIVNAFKFFEGHGEMKRKYEGSRRWIVQPELSIETDKLEADKKETVLEASVERGGISVERGGDLCREGGGISVEIHNNNNINNTNINKNSCSSDDEQVIVKKPKKKKPKLSEIEPLRFDEWYKIYPRKQAYGKAKESWVKNKLDEKADIVIEFLKKQIELEYNYTEKQYAPMPATWLNQKRWEDEIIDKSFKSKPIQNNQHQFKPQSITATVNSQSTSWKPQPKINTTPMPEALRKMCNLKPRSNENEQDQSRSTTI